MALLLLQGKGGAAVALLLLQGKGGRGVCACACMCKWGCVCGRGGRGVCVCSGIVNSSFTHTKTHSQRR